MCGIVGLLNFTGFDRQEVKLRLGAALQQISRRGPDGEGRWMGNLCALGHRRLAIVDLSAAGHQPMERGSLVITFNGMIYNYHELRRELEAKGERFVSDTDTEVLLAGWHVWGEGLLARLDGMFAFGIWDRERRRLVLVRDRFGKKPLVWKRRGNTLVFASDLRALQQLDGVRGTIDSQALAAYFALKYVPEPHCILQGCAKVPPGGLVVVDSAGVQERLWYHLQPNPQIMQLAAVDRPRYIRDLVVRATKARLVADVPIGAFLSGGIDSAVIAFAAGRSIRTFTVGFEGAGAYYEERPQARRTADHIGSQHVELSLGAAEAKMSMESVFDGLDEPFADSSAIPAFLVSRAIRQHAVVALSGDGGDEIFGGYRRHQGELYSTLYRKIPDFLRHGLIDPVLAALPEGKGSWLLERIRRARRFASAGALDESARHAGWMRALAIDETNAIGASDFDLEAYVARARKGAPMDDSISRTLFADIGVLLPGQMLVKIDRMSMANAVEVRSPLLDHHLVEAAIALPPSSKVAFGRGKAILRDAFKDALPPELFARPKKGFELPIAEWLKAGPWRDVAEAATDPALLPALGLPASNLGREWLAELDHGHRDTSDRIWTLIALHQWVRRQRDLNF